MTSFVNWSGASVLNFTPELNGATPHLAIDGFSGALWLLFDGDSDAGGTTDHADDDTIASTLTVPPTTLPVAPSR